MSRAEIRWLVTGCLEQVTPDAYPPDAVAGVIEEPIDDVKMVMEELTLEGRLKRRGNGYWCPDLDTRVA